MHAKNCIFLTLLILALFAAVYFNTIRTKPTSMTKLECKENYECSSGVCNRLKKDYGTCAPDVCVPGERIDNNNFFCNNKGKWQKSKITGENCKEDYECFKSTCFMIPDCEMTDIPRTEVTCEENKCVSEIKKDECELKGMKRVIKKQFFTKTETGDCFESIAQRTLPTICIPCGNNVCDEEESECNCPEDCR